MLQDGAVSNHDINGELVRSFPSVAAMGFSDTARVGHLPWYELQAELADWLPKGSLVLDSSFSSLEQDSSGMSPIYIQKNLLDYSSQLSMLDPV